MVGVGSLHFASILVVWASYGCQARLGARLGRFKGVILLFVDLPFGGMLESLLPPNGYIFEVVFKIDYLIILFFDLDPIFHANLLAKHHQKPLKIDAKRRSIFKF